MGRLSDAVQKQELLEKSQAKPEHSKKSPVSSISGKLQREKTKDKQISAKVNETMYNTFTQINKAQGLTNNSALNMLISRYVRENKEILENDIGI